MGEFIAGAGGKRLRPILLLMAARLVGYRGPRAVRMGCVVELLHTATLIHDDVVDQAPLRRGRPSANARWGDDASILVGDHLYSKSFALMVEDGDPAVLETLARATVSMTEAEVLQLERKRTGSASEADAAAHRDARARDPCREGQDPGRSQAPCGRPGRVRGDPPARRAVRRRPVRAGSSPGLRLPRQAGARRLPRRRGQGDAAPGRR